MSAKLPAKSSQIVRASSVRVRLIIWANAINFAANNGEGSDESYLWSINFLISSYLYKTSFEAFVISCISLVCATLRATVL